MSWELGAGRWVIGGEKNGQTCLWGESENDSKSLLNEEDDKSLTHSLLKYVALAK